MRTSPPLDDLAAWFHRLKRALVPLGVRSYNQGMAAGPLHEPCEHLKLPQFGLRTLFLIVAVLGILFAVMAAIGAAASGAMLLVLAGVGLHVAGNWVGTSLRDSDSKDYSPDVPFEASIQLSRVNLNQPLPPAMPACTVELA